MKSRTKTEFKISMQKKKSQKAEKKTNCSPIKLHRAAQKKLYHMSNPNADNIGMYVCQSFGQQFPLVL